MKIFLTIIAVIVLILLILLLTNLKINIRYANLGGEGRFRVKVYIFKFLRVFKMTKVMKSEKKKFRDQVKMIIDYLFKSKADPIEYAEKELKKSKDAPNIIKNIDITKIFIDYFSLDLFLDFDNAAITAVTTGAANVVDCSSDGDDDSSCPPLDGVDDSSCPPVEGVETSLFDGVDS